MKSTREILTPGEKVKFNKSYPLQEGEQNKLYNLGIMMKIYAED